MIVRALITGGAGFVGSHTAAEFVRRGYEVVCYDLTPPRLDLLDEAAAGVSFYRGDILDTGQLLAAVDQHQVEGVIHTAALIRQEDGARDPLRTYRINVEGTMSVLEVVRGRSLKMVFVSTATLYGIHHDLHTLSENERPDIVGIYDATKLAAETMCVAYHKVFGLDIVAVRPGFVYGAGNTIDAYFLNRAFAGEQIEEPVGADLPMDMTYVKDLARGIYLAYAVRPIKHRVFNITGGRLYTRQQLADAVRRLIPGARIKLGPGVPERTHLRGPSDLSRAKAELGYQPQFDLDAGLADWLTWLQRQSSKSPSTDT